jgi:hypothetical protein
MKMENSPNHENIQEDIAYIKSMIHRTQRVIDPGAYFFILWGIIIIIGNGILPLISPKLIEIYWLTAAPITAIVSFIIGAFIFPKTSRCTTLLSKQIGQLWGTFGWTAILILFLSFFFPQNINGIQLGFIIYMLMALALFSTGIIYLSEYYVAGILVFIGGILSYFNPTMLAISLTGLMAGSSMIVLGILALLRLKQIQKDVE